jgi:hypothetical protein
MNLISVKLSASYSINCCICMRANNASFFKIQSLLKKRKIKSLNSVVGGPFGPGGRTVRDSTREVYWRTCLCLPAWIIRARMPDCPHKPN